MKNRTFCPEYGCCSTNQGDPFVRVTFFDGLAVEDIANVLGGDIDSSLTVDEMNNLLKIRLKSLENFAGKYVALSEKGEFLGSSKSYTQLFTDVKVLGNEVRVYRVPPKDRWGA